MPAANPPSSTPRSTRRGRATSPPPPSCRWSPATRTGGPALEQSFAILADALRAPPSAVEIDREIRNLRTSVTAAVQGEPTARSQSRADQLVNAIDNGSVVATAQTVLDNFERNVPLMTPERVGAAMQRLFTGSGPRMMLISPRPVAGGEAALAEGLAAARAVTPAERRAERRVSFDDLPPLGAPAARSRGSGSRTWT